MQTKTDGKTRAVVLVIDESGSMEGTPIAEVTQGVRRFAEDIVAIEAETGLVGFSDNAQEISPLSSTAVTLQRDAEQLNADGGTNIENGLTKADEMLSKSKAEKKTIVLMTDGMANNGKTGDELKEYGKELQRKGYDIHTLGFFADLSESEKTEAQGILDAIASTGKHHEITNVNVLRFFFGDIADQLSGKNYNYIKIACPVDVEVTYEGETLSSKNTTESQRTSFGTLTFENEQTPQTSPNEYVTEKESATAQQDLVKILRLREGPAYEVKITGYDTGTMNAEIGFVDDSGDYTDMRYFDDIKVSNTMTATTVAQPGPAVRLSVDSDSDGIADETYVAGPNEHAKLKDNSHVVDLVVGAFIVTALLLVALAGWLVLRKTKRTR